GILEIADVFVVNKADLEGHQRVATELRAMLSMVSHTGSWKPPIVATSAANQEGIDKLWEAVQAHRKHREETGRKSAQAEQRLRDEVAEVAAEMARDRAREALSGDGELVERLKRDGTPYEVAERILRDLT